MRIQSIRHKLAAAVMLMALCMPLATAQEAGLAWDQVQFYRYNILNVIYDSGTRTVTVIFSITNPAASNAPYDILGATVATPFKAPATLRVDFSWNSGNWGTSELINTKDGPFSLVPRTITAGVVTGTAPASAVAINALTLAKRCTDAGSPCPAIPNGGLTYWVKQVLPSAATGDGRVGIEGHPSIQTGIDPATSLPVFTSIPATSVFKDFAITAGAPARRKVVDIAKCKQCHNDRVHGAGIVPRLSLHGANRNEELGVCVMCHNPSQTDAAYRTSGAEESIDFKRLVHGIHSGGFRRNPYIVIGRNGSVNDYSTVRFPKKLRDCANCHIDVSGNRTYALPLASTLGSTIVTGSDTNGSPGYVDIDPNNDLKISPIAATCSACHDGSEVRRHMVRNGASFGVAQSVLAGKEQCVNCHGPGKSEDVRRVHEVGDH